MKRMALLGALVALAAIALPSAAMAGRLSGVVVAKDAARRSVAIAARGEVRTVRTNRFGALKVGRRVTATGATLTDGSFAARTVKAGPRVTKVQFRAVVVRHEAAKQRLIVSAGGTVFAFRLAGGATFASDDGLSPGDQVTVSADVKKHELEAQHEDVKETGHVEALKLEGIFLHQGQDSFDIAVVHRGLVHIHFTPGTDLPEWKPGDIVVAVVSVGDDSSFTFVGGRTDGKPGSEAPKSDPPNTKEPTYYAGVLAERSATQVSVLREDGTTVTCAVPSTLDVSAFSPGQKVYMACRSGDHGLVLVAMKSPTGTTTGPGTGDQKPVETAAAGAIAEISASAVSVKKDDGTRVVCALLGGFDFSAFRVGDMVKLTCTERDGKAVTTSLRSDRAFVNVTTNEVGLIGTLAERTPTGVSVNADGATLHCGIATPVDLSPFSLGQKVALSCKRSDAGLTFALLYADSLWVKADGTAERTVYGTLAERGESTVTVTLEGGVSLSCAAPSTIDLSGFHTGDKVKMRCRLREGTWRLSLLRSETATVEVPL
jgi:hypothetical protein